MVMALAMAFVLADCSTEDLPSGPPGPPNPPAARHFELGLSPFAPRPDPAAAIESFDFAGTHGEIVSNHFEDVPWDSTMIGHRPQPEVTDLFTYRRDRGAELGVRNFVSLSWLNANRDAVGLSWGSRLQPPAIGNAPFFSNPAVRRALTYWCAWTTSFYRPDRMAIGVEINSYASRRPGDWANLVSLYRAVYDTLKVIRPEMEVFPTWQLEWMDLQNQWGLVSQLEDKMDGLGLSLYPGLRLSGLQFWRPDMIPADYLSRVRGLTGTSKPIFITETGWGDSTIAPPGWQGSLEMQRDYLAWLIGESDAVGIRQVIWFFGADAWDIVDPIPPPLRGILPFFASMGLRKRDLAPKPALSQWESARARPYAP